MNQTQRRVLEDTLKRAEQGPHLSPIGRDPALVKELEKEARRWADTWIAQPIRDILAQQDGRMTAYELNWRNPR